MMDIEDLKDYLVEEAEYSREEVEGITPFELVHHWLQWNGILGYTSDILEVVQAAYPTMEEVREVLDY